MAAATKMPALAISAWLKFWASATAAMAFMGCTGKGMPKARPVSMLASPLKTSVLEREMARIWVRAMRMGRRVPRSPKAPDISVNGWREKVSRLYRWVSRMVVRQWEPNERARVGWFVVDIVLWSMSSWEAVDGSWAR